MPYFTPAGIQLFFSAICQIFAMGMLRFDLFFQVLNLLLLLSLLFFLIRSRFLFLFKTITTSPITKSQENLVLLLMPSPLTYQTKKMLVPSLIQHHSALSLLLVKQLLMEQSLFQQILQSLVQQMCNILFLIQSK